MSEPRRIQVAYDAEAQVWWAESDDLAGLVSEAPTLDALFDRVAAVVPDLLAAGGGVVHQPITLEFCVIRHIETV
jgi:hypothetical protein